MRVKLVSTLSLIAFSMFLFSCKTVNNLATANHNFETQMVEDGAQGTIIVKSWGTGKNVKKAKEDACKNAVYTLIFKGIPNSSEVRPLISDPSIEQKKSEYFAPFFATNGGYTRYVSFASGNGYLDATDKEKVGRLYKVGVVVVINKLLLSSELESAGIKSKFGIN